MAAAGMAGAYVPNLFDRLHKEFTCSICLELFNRPKELPCQHTFCQDCLERLAGEQEAFTCPECRRQIQLPPGGVSHFPDNHHKNTVQLFQIQWLPTQRRATIGSGEFSYPSGIAVSENGEIFVADYDNQNVQVFMFNGASVRHFPTIVPGEDGQKIHPEDMAMDGEGNMWVVGNEDSAASHGFAVQYNKHGEVLSHFQLPWSRYFRGVAVDTKMNHILVTHRGGNIHKPTGAVHVYRPDGKRVNTVEQQGMEFPKYITVDGEGRILVTDEESHFVYVFDQDGQFLFQFNRGRGDNRLLQDPRGICTDSSGNIFVADYETGHVEMFDKSGSFLRHIAIDMKAPQVLVISPQGQLVVADNVQNKLTIFHKM